MNNSYKQISNADLANRNPKKWKNENRGFWRPHEDDLILNKWGRLGMQGLREAMPHKTTGDILGRRVYLLKRQGVQKL
jgi:hypothetical protein